MKVGGTIWSSQTFIYFFIPFFVPVWHDGNHCFTKKCFQLTSCFHSLLGVKVFKDCLHITIYPPWQRPGHSKPHLTDIIASLDSWLSPSNLAPLVAQTPNFSWQTSDGKCLRPVFKFHHVPQSITLRFTLKVRGVVVKKTTKKTEDQEHKVMPCGLCYRESGGSNRGSATRACVHFRKLPHWQNSR